MANFELISKYKEQINLLPKRKTSKSAGYDFFIAEDTLIPPYDSLSDDIYYACAEPETGNVEPVTLNELAAITKKLNAKPTLIPTGVKCKMADDEYLDLTTRSSTPLKYWIIIPNAPARIDADYYNNPDNEGHIYIQAINLSPLPIILKKGDCIAQGIIHKYIKIEGDAATGDREGGFGSTGV